jgi:uncharacterized protein
VWVIALAIDYLGPVMSGVGRGWRVAPEHFAERHGLIILIAENRDLGEFLGSDAGENFFSGAWGWFALTVVLQVFNSVLGEELLFRGLLLPRMNGVFGRADWAANGVLFAGYHLHVPWAIPAALLDTFLLSYPTKRYRSAWIGIAVHSAQSVFIIVFVLTLVV